MTISSRTSFFMSGLPMMSRPLADAAVRGDKDEEHDKSKRSTLAATGAMLACLARENLARGRLESSICSVMGRLSLAAVDVRLPCSDYFLLPARSNCAA